MHYCGRGEECVALGGVARCICVRKCGPAKRRVCGTDGQLYDNRCELHKAGCLTGVNIEIDHSLKCFIPSGESEIKSKHRSEVVYCATQCLAAPPSRRAVHVQCTHTYIIANYRKRGRGENRVLHTSHNNNNIFLALAEIKCLLSSRANRVDRVTAVRP